MIIPHQLQKERFIVLSERGKFPVQKWSDPKYQFTADKIQKWVDCGWNYGVIYTTDLCVMDADDTASLNRLGVLQSLPKTFTVMSGRDTVGLHLYFRMPNPPEGTKIYMYDEDGCDIGDFRLPHSRFYNVGPGSIHPSGRPYAVAIDAEIATLDWDTLKTAFGNITVKVAGVNRNVSAQPVERRTSSLDEYGLTALDFLMPLKPKTRGDEIEGEHPIHGSSTGNNLTVKCDGSVWWCRRCGSGGNWIDALAVSEGIIDCSQAHPGRGYNKEEWKKINEVLRRIKPDIYERQKKRWVVERNATALDKLRTRLDNAYPSNRVIT